MTGGAFGSLFAADIPPVLGRAREIFLIAGAAWAVWPPFLPRPLQHVARRRTICSLEWKPRSFIPVAVSAVVASALRVPLLGAGPIFPIAPHAAMTAGELAVALGVGVGAGLFSGLLTNLVYGFEDLFAKFPIHWMWWPAIGAVFVGIGGYLDPRVLGVGYGIIHSLLSGELIGITLLGLLVGKAFVWSIALGSGTSGGVLAPLLIMGGALGALLSRWLPAGDAGLWAMVGMAAIMGGTMRAPFTGMVFLLELTHDLNALPAVMVGSVAALGVTVLILRRSILTEKIARRGLHISCEYSVDPMNFLRVGQVMDVRPPSVPADLSIAKCSGMLADGHPDFVRRQGTLIVDSDGLLVGIITRGDVVRALQQSSPAAVTVLQAGNSNPVVTYPDELLHDAVARMLEHDIGRLPVVDREHNRAASSVTWARRQCHGRAARAASERKGTPAAAARRGTPAALFRLPRHLPEHRPSVIGTHSFPCGCGKHLLREN